MILPSDPQGFLLGQKLELNIDETRKVVDAVKELRGELSEIKRLLAGGAASRGGQGSGQPTPNPNPPAPSGTPRRRARVNAGGGAPTPAGTPAVLTEPTPPGTPTPRPLPNRGAGGRLERLSPEEQARREELRQERTAERESRERSAQSAELVRNLSAAVEGTDRIDPIVSAVSELGSLMKPLRAIGSATLAATKAVSNGVQSLASPGSGGFISKVLALLTVGGLLWATSSGSGGKSAAGDEGSWADRLKKAFNIKPKVTDGVNIGGTGVVQNADIGSISAHHESGSRPGIVNLDPANKSTNYGMYQFNLATGGLAKFLKEADPAMIAGLKSLTPGTPEFAAEWRNIARKDPKAFAAEQTRVAKMAFLDPLLPSAAKAGLDIDNPAIQAALLSASIQHGPKGNKTIYQNMGNVSGLPIEEQLNRFYASRGAYTANLPKTAKWTDKDVRQAQARYAKELPAAVAMSRNIPAPVKMPTAPAPAPTPAAEQTPVKTNTVKPTDSGYNAPLGQNLSDRQIAQIATGGIGQNFRGNW